MLGSLPLLFLAATASGLPVTITVDTTKILNLLPPTYVSANLDWHYDAEEWPAWKGCSVINMSVTEPNLVYLASQFSPAVLRVGGSEGDDVIYATPSTPCPVNTSFCLSPTRWGEIGAFAQKTGMDIAFGLNALSGRQNKTCRRCPWDSTNTRDFLANVVIPSGFIPKYAEFGNELQTFIDADVYGQDILHLKSVIDSIQWPSSPPLLVANDENPDAGYWSKLLPIAKDVMDVASWHLYVGYGLDPALPSDAWETPFMDKITTTAAPLIAAAGASGFKGGLWVGESAMAWHSGREGVTDTFLSSPWWVSALGTLAPTHTGFCRQTLMGGRYELVNKTTRAPNPDYYVALLWKSTMGEKVLEASVEGSNQVRAFSHCLPAGSPPGVGFAIINFSPNTTAEVPLPEGPWKYYLLSSPDNSTLVSNGVPLQYTPGVLQLPDFHATTGTTAGTLAMPPHTIAFAQVFGENGVCSA
jgi:heparanase 1